MSFELKDYLNAINFDKTNIIEESDDPQFAENQYNPYIVNRILSFFPDCIFFVQDMNEYPMLDKRMQFDYYLYSIRKKKRFHPWLKKEEDENVKNVAKYFDISLRIAQDYVKLLTDNQLEEIKNSTSEGGVVKKVNKRKK